MGGVEFASSIKRIGAVFIDTLTIIFLGFFTGLLGKPILLHMNQWGWFVGLVVVLLYLSLFNSFLGKGQTIGKKILRIKVVDNSGKYISIKRSLLRSFIVVIPFFINPLLVDKLVMYFLLIVIIYSIPISYICFLIVNKKTKQTLHDLLLNTFVVKAGTEKPEINAGADKHIKHFLIILLIISLLSGFNIYGLKHELYAKILQWKKQVMAINSISKVESIIYDDEENKIEVIARLKQKPSSYTSIAKKVARHILGNNPIINKKEINSISISLYYGYDIRIFSSYKKYRVIINKDEINK